MEVAARLLVDTDLSAWIIGEMLGYSSIQVFSRTFLKHFGERPSHFRESNHASAGRIPTPMISTDVVRRVVLGNAAPEEAQAVVQQIQELYDLRELSPDTALSN